MRGPWTLAVLFACVSAVCPLRAAAQTPGSGDDDATRDAPSTPPPVAPSAQPPSPALPPASSSIADSGTPPTTPSPAPFGVRLVAEGGFIAVFSNFGVFGQDGTRIDFKEAAGQKNLSFYTRWSAELEVGRRHTIVVLYQPLSTDGIRTPTTDERYENVTFRAGVPVRTEFRFPFYRLSYLYALAQGEAGAFALGLTGQIRNADYRYTRLDGTAFADSSSVGFVPALKLRGELAAGRHVIVGFEADGIYAPISLINGSTNETVGAILDASIRAGVRLEDRGQAFVVLRYLGGGATNEDPADYAKNWLHFAFFGVGASLDLLAAPTRVHRPARDGP